MPIALGVGSVVGIAIGAGILFGIILVSITILIVVHRYKSQDVERALTKSKCGSVKQKTAQTAPRPLSLPERLSLPFTGWDQLPSVENLQRLANEPQSSFEHDEELPRKRKTFIRWPKRRISKRAVHLSNIRPPHLSAIIESPKQTSQLELRTSTIGAALTTKMLNSDRPNDKPKFNPVTPPDSPQLAGMRKSAPVQSINKSLTEEVLDYAKSCAYHSAPSDLGHTSKKRAPGEFMSPLRPHKHHRSTSFCSQEPSAPPSQPLPPVPPNIVFSPSQAMSRQPSNHSTSSEQSISSSILKSTSPNMKAMAEFQQRNPEMNLGPRIREGETDLKDSLISNSRHSSIRSKRSNVLLYPNAADVLARKGISPKQTGKTLSEQELHDSSEHDRLDACFHGQRYSHDATKLSSTSKNQQQYHESPAVTPNKKQLTVRKVSASGSPAPRSKISVLKDVSGNQAIPSREPSQTSMISSSTSTSDNPFKWDPSYVNISGKPSAMKGSPTSNKKHKRQNCVRISVQPTVLGPPSRPASASRMLDIAEEAPLLSRPASVPLRPPSRNDFDPDLYTRRDSRRLSTTPSSPTLSSINQFYQAAREPRPRPPSRISSQSPLRSNIRPQSAVSSIVTISAFPSPGKSSPTPMHSDESHDSSSESLAIPPKNSARISNIIIPGLNLITNEPMPLSENQTFEYPMIELQSSPPRSSREFPTPRSREPPTNLTNTRNSIREYSQPQFCPEPLSPTLPERVSPSPKSSPTTSLSAINWSELPTRDANHSLFRPTPLASTVNPLMSKPDLFPTRHNDSDWEPQQLYLHNDGAASHISTRSAPGPSLQGMAPALNKSIGELRRMNSDIVTPLGMDGSYQRTSCFQLIPQIGTGARGKMQLEKSNKSLLRYVQDSFEEAVDVEDKGKENRHGNAQEIIAAQSIDAPVTLGQLENDTLRRRSELYDTRGFLRT